MTADPIARIDAAALRHNLARVREAAPGRRVLAVVKANAYGHGLTWAARALADADGFGVARVSEGVRLRESGVEQPVVVLEGLAGPDDLQLASRHRLTLVIHHAGQIEWLEQAGPTTTVSCWLKVDTGMHRLGFAPDEVAAVYRRLSACRAVLPGVGLVTHLANADDRSDSASARQIAVFDTVRRELGVDRIETSIANSGGILGWPAAHGDWVRPGIMLYGASPFAGRTGPEDGLRPVMTLHTRLIAVHEFPQGVAIGYSGTWSCPEPMRVGVAAIGYGDGYPRHAPSGTPVLLNGSRVPLIGRVSMDMITVDLRTQPQAQVGDPVVLWGDGLAVEEIAEWAGTISYELLCGVTARVGVESV